MAADIFQYCPDVMKDVLEFQELPKMINPEFDLIREAQERKLRNQYIFSCDEEGITDYEKRMKITPLPTATLEDRQMSVFVAWNSSTPFTERKLISMLDALLGRDYYTLTITLNEYRVHVLLQLEVKGLKKTVEDLLDKIVPENMVLEVQLRGNTYGNLKEWGYTYGELEDLGLTYGEIAWTVLKR